MSDTMALRCGTVALIGAPNAGKSTLVNQLVGQKVAITSSKAQTTRTRMTGIALLGNTQAMILDTPGIFDGKDRMDRAMVAAARDSLEGADVVLVMRDASRKKHHPDERIMEFLTGYKGHVVLILNKVDRADKPQLLLLAEEMSAQIGAEETFFTNSLTGEGIDPLRDYLERTLPEGPWHYPEEQVSDVSQRLFAAEVTREQLYHQLHAELPYASVVVTEKYEERADGSLEIHQQILVERETQKAIILGKGGSRIKEIGAKARQELGGLIEAPVHLYLHVKVDPNWRDTKDVYSEIGLEWGQ
ncbi:GTPase Era [Alterisphingorhabdus coralli]|uniref:GTPase Era n=1 Tax=Alterisphingorhabdus coralli TaxID=3071408 RepID=A0AA97F4Q3_9SPHN|nr:GTPase Era [Parasphingorhabdus sp. SCSIO 66989]WOE73993.1 GTPase Era [Parasphingorhabdus sp. SCSIO 66989]